MKQILHKNKWFAIEKHVLKNGQEYFLLKKQPTVFIVAETKDKKLVLVKEYRYPIKHIIWQLPAGMVEGRDTLRSAKRELFEETGLRAKNWFKIGHFFVAPGHENTKIIVFVAKNLITTKDSYKTSEADILEIKAFSESKIEEMIRDNKILCSISLAALNLYYSGQVQ
ncbi:MAG: NUDIX hydrolase [bacterium]|nr:NUDIX hydrolase [bacterium]